MIEKYLNITRGTSDDIRVHDLVRDDYELAYANLSGMLLGALSGALRRDMTLPSLVLVKSPFALPEIVTIVSKSYLVYDQRLAQVLNGLSRLIFEESSEKAANNYLCELFAQRCVSGGQYRRAAEYWLLQFKIVREREFLSPVASMTRLSYTFMQEAFVIAHSVVHHVCCSHPDVARDLADIYFGVVAPLAESWDRTQTPSSSSSVKDSEYKSVTEAAPMTAIIDRVRGSEAAMEEVVCDGIGALVAAAWAQAELDVEHSHSYSASLLALHAMQLVRIVDSLLIGEWTNDPMVGSGLLEETSVRVNLFYLWALGLSTILPSRGDGESFDRVNSGLQDIDRKYTAVVHRRLGAFVENAKTELAKFATLNIPAKILDHAHMNLACWEATGQFLADNLRRSDDLQDGVDNDGDWLRV